MSHIPPEALLPQDMVDVLDRQTGAVARWHAVDAKHALSVDPDRWEIVIPGKPEPQEQPEPHDHHAQHRDSGGRFAKADEDAE